MLIRFVARFARVRIRAQRHLTRFFPGGFFLRGFFPGGFFSGRIFSGRIFSGRIFSGRIFSGRIFSRVILCGYWVRESDFIDDVFCQYHSFHSDKTKSEMELLYTLVSNLLVIFYLIEQ